MDVGVDTQVTLGQYEVNFKKVFYWRNNRIIHDIFLLCIGLIINVFVYSKDIDEYFFLI